MRDKTGKPADNLRADEFQLLDRGKPQTISKFSFERSGGTAITRTPAAGETPGLFNEAPALIAPDHFVGLLFDDIHANFGELSITRTAAQKFIASALKPADRVAIFTTSGETSLEFTDDRDKLNQSLLWLAPHPVARSTSQECPDISSYQLLCRSNHGIQSVSG